MTKTQRKEQKKVVKVSRSKDKHNGRLEVLVTYMKRSSSVLNNHKILTLVWYKYQTEFLLTVEIRITKIGSYT